MDVPTIKCDAVKGRLGSFDLSVSLINLGTMPRWYVNRESMASILCACAARKPLLTTWKLSLGKLAMLICNFNVHDM